MLAGRIAGFNLVLLLAFSSSVFSQERGDAWDRYNAEKKSEAAAAALEFLLPLLGHGYAGEIREGLPPLAVSGGGIALVIVGATVCDQEIRDVCIDEGNGTIMALGWLAYLGGRVWGIFSALDVAEEHNAALRRRLNLSLQPSKRDLELALTYAF